VVAHLSNPSFAWSYGADDSPLGSGNSAKLWKFALPAGDVIFRNGFDGLARGIAAHP